MRIAHLEAGRHLYGGAAQVRYLLDGLAARGVDNVLVCPPGSALGATAPAAQVRELPMRGELDVTMLPRLVRALRSLGADLLHVHSRRGADLYGGVAALLAGVPAVITRRVDSPEPAWLARSELAYEMVVALSRAIERQLLATGLPADPSWFRAPSIPQRFRPDGAARDRLLAQFGLPAGALVIGVAAQLIERKGHSLLFAALPQLVREWPQLRVLCFGRGPLEQRLRRELADRGLADNVDSAAFAPICPSSCRGSICSFIPLRAKG